MTSYFKGRTSTDSQRPQSRKSTKSRFSFSTQSRENIALPLEEIPPVPPLPSDTKDDFVVVSKDAPDVGESVSMADAVQEMVQKIDADVSADLEPAQPVQAPQITKTLPPVPESKSSNGNSKSDQTATLPKRSSSFRNVLNSYWKVFGGSPKKPPKHEKPHEEAERLRRTVKKYEAQLEEASNILLLQDKVIARWENDAVIKGTKVANVTSNGVTSVIPVEKVADVGHGQTEDTPSDNSRSLGLIRESSREMLSDTAAQQAKASSGLSPPPLSAHPIFADTSASDRKQTSLQSRIDALEQKLGRASAALDSQSRSHAEHSTLLTSQLEEMASTKNESAAENERLILLLEEARKNHESILAEHESTRVSLAEHVVRVDEHSKELGKRDDEHELTKASLAEQTALVSAHSEALAKKDEEHELTRSLLAEQTALAKAHAEALSKKEEEHSSLAQLHEQAIAYHGSHLDEISAKYQALQRDHETLNGKHVAALAAVAAATAAASLSLGSQSEEHQAAVASLNKDLEVARAEIEESTLLSESMKKEHADAISALSSQLDTHGSDMEKLRSEAQSHEQRASALDEELSEAKQACREAEEGHVSAKGELASLSAEKLELEVSIASLTTATAGHDAQVAELEKVHKEVAELKQELESHVLTKSELEARIATLTTATAGHDAQVAELEKVNKEVAELKQELESHALTKSELEAQIATLKQEAEQHTATHTELETSRATVAELQGHVDSHAVANAELESKIAGLETDLTTHTTTHATLQQQISELESGVDSHAVSKSELEAKIAALEANSHSSSTSQAELQAKIAELEGSLEDHTGSKSQLETQIASLRAEAEKHATTASDLETSRARIAELEPHVELHATTKADLATAQAQILALQAVSDSHEALETEHSEAKAKIESLSRDVEAHQAVQDDLLKAQTQITDLEKLLETGKVDHSTLTEKLGSLEASLATATTEQEKLTADLSDKEKSLQEALDNVATHAAQLKAQSTALATAQESLDKANSEASQADIVLKELKTAENKIAGLEAELTSASEKHTAERATLSSELEDLQDLRGRVLILKQQLEEAQVSEGAAKATIAQLEANLRDAKDAKSPRFVGDAQEDGDNSKLEKAGLAAAAVGALGGGAWGISKLVDHSDDKSVTPEPHTEAQSDTQASESRDIVIDDGENLVSPTISYRKDTSDHDQIAEVSLDSQPLMNESSKEHLSDSEPLSNDHVDAKEIPQDLTPSTQDLVDKPATTQPAEETSNEELPVEMSSESEAQNDKSAPAASKDDIIAVEDKVNTQEDDFEAVDQEQPTSAGLEETEHSSTTHVVLEEPETLISDDNPLVDADHLSSTMPESDALSIVEASGEHESVAKDAPQIQCLTCGEALSTEKLAEHFCTPVASPADESETGVQNAPVEKDVEDRDIAAELPSSDPVTSSDDREPEKTPDADDNISEMSPELAGHDAKLQLAVASTDGPTDEELGKAGSDAIQPVDITKESNSLDDADSDDALQPHDADNSFPEAPDVPRGASVNITELESAELESSPPSPLTPSRRKSVRWEDIENSKQSTPVLELDRQVGEPRTNGDHMDRNAGTHSLGPGSPVAEMHGLAISDVALTEEPIDTAPETTTVEQLPPAVAEAPSAEDLPPTELLDQNGSTPGVADIELPDIESTPEQADIKLPISDSEEPEIAVDESAQVAVKESSGDSTNTKAEEDKDIAVEKKSKKDKKKDKKKKGKKNAVVEEDKPNKEADETEKDVAEDDASEPPTLLQKLAGAAQDVVSSVVEKLPLSKEDDAEK